MCDNKWVGVFICIVSIKIFGFLIYNKGGDFLSKPEMKTSIEIFGCWTILDMI